MNYIFRDREFIRTPENLFFCIIGDQHPRDKAISYLRYALSSSGNWGKDSKHYRRTMPEYSIPHLLKNIRYLKKKFPQYVFYSDVFNIEISAVPNSNVSQQYMPQEKLKQLSKIKEPDILQKRALEIVTYISETVKIPKEVFGITGSILIDIHNTKFSDVDLTVMGGKNGFKLKKALPDLFLEKDGPMNYVSENVLKKLFAARVKEHHLSFDEIKALNNRQWNYGTFKGTTFSLHTTRSESEIIDSYGDYIFHSLGLIKGNAIITDISESLFNPHIYKIKAFKNTEQNKSMDIKEVVTYSGIYGGKFEVGENMDMHGKLERVENKINGKLFQRIIIGSPEADGHDYMKPIKS